MEREKVKWLVVFPSPQGGSETRKLTVKEAMCDAGFHPLKAGRRQSSVQRDRCGVTRFPSPQGGSETPTLARGVMQTKSFPSPQGGSETTLFVVTATLKRLVSIPSRRVGDRSKRSGCAAIASVSIPSRRVGDVPLMPSPITGISGFHPLKAGRRPAWKMPANAKRKNVSIPSRRVGDWFCQGINCGDGRVSIPSRRVGDFVGKIGQIVGKMFPSPQGGSETFGKWYFHFPIFVVSIPSRRVGDFAMAGHQRGAMLVSIPSRRVGDANFPKFG